MLIEIIFFLQLLCNQNHCQNVSLLSLSEIHIDDLWLCIPHILSITEDKCLWCENMICTKSPSTVNCFEKFSSGFKNTYLIQTAISLQKSFRSKAAKAKVGFPFFCLVRSSYFSIFVHIKVWLLFLVGFPIGNLLLSLPKSQELRSGMV